MTDNTLLERLFRGELCPQDTIDPCSDTYRQTAKALSDGLDWWKDRLSPKELIELQEMQRLWIDWYSMEQSEAFRCGVTLGVLFLMEALEGREAFLRQGQFS